MTFSSMDGMFNFRAALEDYGYTLANVTVNNAPRTLGEDTRGDDDGIIESSRFISPGVNSINQHVTSNTIFINNPFYESNTTTGFSNASSFLM